jgi:hypothetical protein
MLSAQSPATVIPLFEKSRAVVRRKADGRAFADLAGSLNLTRSNMPSMAGLSGAKGKADEALAWTVVVTDWGLVGMDFVEAFGLAWTVGVRDLGLVGMHLVEAFDLAGIVGVRDSGLVGMHLAEGMAEDVELVVTRIIPVERADLGLVGTGWVGDNQMELASTLVEYGSVVGDPNNTLQILPDVDLPAVGSSQVSLVYDTACHKGPTEYSGTVVGRPGTLGWQVGFHLPSEPAAVEALACLGDTAALEGPDRRRCIPCHQDLTTWVLSWPFATSLRLHPWSVRLAWTREQMW